MFIGSAMDEDPMSMKDFFVEPQKGFWLVSKILFALLCYILLRYYATSQKVAGSKPDEANKFFQFTLSFQPH
jgi:uncharacterized membrane protein SirB2